MKILICFLHGYHIFFDELNEFEIKLPEIFRSFQLLRFLPDEFDSIVQSILRWKLSDLKYEDILIEFIAEESRLKLREKDRASFMNPEVQMARKMQCKRCFNFGHPASKCNSNQRTVHNNKRTVQLSSKSPERRPYSSFSNSF